MQNSPPTPFLLFALSTAREMSFCVCETSPTTINTHTETMMCLCMQILLAAPAWHVYCGKIKWWKPGGEGKIQRGTPRLSCPCKVPEFLIQAAPSPVWIISHKTREQEGSRLRQDGTVAAVSDTRETPSVCVCYRPVSNTCLDCDKYLLLVSSQLPAGLAMKHNCSRCSFCLKIKHNREKTPKLSEKLNLSLFLVLESV